MKPALMISDRDNVATALETLEPGRSIEIGGRTIVVRESIPSGHKLALIAIAEGGAVLKYGSAIGTATAAISPGMHVHTHNLASSRGRGDLELPSVRPEPGVRLAEPADEKNGFVRAEPVRGTHE
jgi:altronate dehydratase